MDATKTDTYLCIKNPSHGIFKDRGSKFLSYAYPVNNEEEIKEHLDKLRKQYHDARHHCYAYRLGTNTEAFRANDDGEPSNSAGKPILNQIDAMGLTNILIVVVRYFGGTLLGVGGLINAYKNAASVALSKAEIVNKTINDVYKIEYSYAATNEVLRIINDEGLHQASPTYNENCSFVINIPKNSVQRVISRLNIIESVKIAYIKTQ